MAEYALKAAFVLLPLLLWSVLERLMAMRRMRSPASGEARLSSRLPEAYGSGSVLNVPER
jgi:hypothetical protein